MPQLTTNSTKGYVSRWTLEIGDSVKAGETVAEISSDLSRRDKKLVSISDGIVLYHYVYPGVKVPVGSPLLIIGQKGEDLEDVIKRNSDQGQTLIFDIENRLEKIEEEIIVLKSSLGQGIQTSDINLKDLKQEVFDLIGKNKLLESFDLLLNHSDTSFELKKELVFLKSRYNRLFNERHKRIISNEEFVKEESAVISTLLNLVKH